MAPTMASSTRERLRKMALLNPPLPLNGSQFLPRDIYTIPPDEPPRRKAPVASSERRLPPGSQDSPLSEDELEAVYGTGIASSPPNVTAPSRPAGALSAGSVLSPPLSARQPGRKARVSIPAKRLPGKEAANKRKRRLPVHELMLVSSPTPNALHDPVSSYAGGEEQDPIDGIAQYERQSSSEKGAGVEAPLTLIRKRLRTPRFTHKSVVALRKKHQQSATPFFPAARHAHDLGDGFDASERKPVPQRLVATVRRAPKPLRQFHALTIRTGPLPEVAFQTSSSASAGQSDSTPLDEQPHISAEWPAAEAPCRTSRRVSFSDEVLARLSSVAAPRRAYSISSDESDDQIEEDDFLGDASASSVGSEQPERESQDPSSSAGSEGIGSRKPGGKRLMEVDEEIISPSASESDGWTELTASNTRRNSRVANTEIDLEVNSRYFTSAAGMLRDASTKPRIIKQRTSDRRSSYYQAEKEMQVPYSEAYITESSTAIRETSPEPQDFTSHQLRLLKRGPAAEWTSSIPKASRDLRALTRRVSQEHGTLSQSSRRRASQIAFRSPSKVR